MQKSTTAARSDVVGTSTEIVRVVMCVSRQHQWDFQIFFISLLVLGMFCNPSGVGQGSEGIAFFRGLVPAWLCAAQDDIGALRHSFRDGHEIVSLRLIHI